MKIQRNFHFLNLAANVLVVATVALLVGLLAYRAFFLPSLSSLEAELLRAGDNFKGLPEVDFKKSPNTILLASDINCQYSDQALPFYKKLITRSKENPAVRVIGVFNNKEDEVERYLREHELNIEFIPAIDLVKLKVDATPAVVWVDSNRKIVSSYEGLFQEKQETAFFELLEEKLFRK